MAFGNYGKRTVRNDEPTYEVIKDYGALSDADVPKRLRVVKWNDNEPKFDIRPWKETEDGERSFKGITLTSEEIENLYKLLKKIDEE